MIPSIAAVRQAHALVDEIHDQSVLSDISRHRLANQAVTNPARIVELVAALAGMVADTRPPDLPRDEVSYQAYLRRAHAAWTRGERLEWVVSGEREYQRIKKANQRARTGGTPA